MINLAETVQYGLFTPLVMMSLTTSILVAIWRVWKFTLRPRLRPDEPLEIPYWLPYIGIVHLIATKRSKKLISSFAGHSYRFWSSSQDLVKSGRQYLTKCGRSSIEPFALSIAGEKLIIVTSGQNAAAFLNNTKTLSWKRFLERLARQFGVEDPQVGIWWHTPTAGEERFHHEDNPGNKTLQQWTVAFYRNQLHPGQSLDDLSSIMLSRLHRELCWKSLQTQYPIEAKPINLLRFCADSMLTVVTLGLFGHLIYEVESNLNQYLYDFNEENWKLLLFSYPKLMARRAEKARSRIFDAVANYLISPVELKEDASKLISLYADEQSRAGCSDQSRAAVTFIFLWGAHSNVYRLTYWILAFVTRDATLLAAIRNETAHAFRDPSTPPDYKNIYQSCPRLAAVYLEALRLTSGSASVRDVISPFAMHGKTLRPGSTIMVPVRELHYNADIFGKNVDEFDANRFFGNDLEKHKWFKPFGGGTTYCSGRFLAKRLTLVFVATLLERFSVDVVGPNEGLGKGLPRDEIDYVSPTFGTMRPEPGRELFVRLAERSKGM